VWVKVKVKMKVKEKVGQCCCKRVLLCCSGRGGEVENFIILFLEREKK